MPTNRDGSGADSAIRVIEIVDVLLARIASGLSTLASSRYIAVLTFSFSVTASTTTSQSAKTAWLVDGARAGRASAAMSIGVARPILIRLITTSLRLRHARGDALVVDVDHHRRDARAGVRRGDARPHLARAEHADALDLARLDRRVGHARVAGEPLAHEEHADQVRRDRRADDLERGLLLGLQAVFEGLVAPLADRLQRGERRGVLPLGLALDEPLGGGEEEHRLVVGQADRLLAPLPAGDPFARLDEVIDQPLALPRRAARRGRRRTRSRAPRPSSASIGSPEQIISTAG